MAKEKLIKDRKYYVCEECGLRYEDIETAQKCEDYCKKHKSCSLEIIKNSIQDIKK